MNIDWLTTSYFFGGVFIIMFLGIFFIYSRRLPKILKNKSRKNNKTYEIMEVNYLAVRKKIDCTKILNKKHICIISILDAFIISFVATVINLINLHILWQLSIGFVLLFLLIYAIYDIYGNFLVAKGYQIEEKRKKVVKNVRSKKNRK